MKEGKRKRETKDNHSCEKEPQKDAPASTPPHEQLPSDDSSLMENTEKGWV